MRVADIVAGTLANFGARQAFGMPGGEVVTLIDALNLAGVDFTLTRHETGAAIMAAGYATATGRPGVIVTTLGPGLINAVNGVADASQEHVPLIVLAGVVDHAVRGRYTHQILDQKAVLGPLVKACFEVEAIGAGAVVARAVELALTHPMGPVLVELAPGTAALLAESATSMGNPVRRITIDPTAHIREFDGIGNAISNAARPLIIAGFDAARGGASERLRLFAERFQIPVITTYKGKGVLPEGHALALGAAGLSPLADRVLLPLCQKADVIILAGYDPIEMRTGWIDPFAPDALVIEIAPGAYDHAMHRSSIRIDGNIGSIIGTLAEAATPSAGVWSCGQPTAATAELQDLFASPKAWGPHAAIDVIQNALPPGAVVTVDSGAHRILLSQKLKMVRPLALLQSAGFCTMGAALPLAAGVKIADRSTPVVAVVGDGGLEMGLGDLATLRDEALPIVIVVFQDQSLALIELKQRQASLPPAGVRLGVTYFEDVAQACGGNGERIASVASFKGALQRAFEADVFSIIVCEIEAEDYAGRI
jgi:acetolactate synthase-1/2/3 large subunit